MEQKNPCVEAQMMIRKPVADVFNAFYDPEQTKNFWFTKGNGLLLSNTKITWEWAMYHHTVEVLVKEVIPEKLIVVEWGDPSTTIEFSFKDMGHDKTYVVIKNYGFAGQGDKLMNEIKDATGGFTTVLDGLKAFMEHGINLNLIADKYPEGH